MEIVIAIGFLVVGLGGYVVGFARGYGIACEDEDGCCDELD